MRPAWDLAADPLPWLLTKGPARLEHLGCDPCPACACSRHREVRGRLRRVLLAWGSVAVGWRAMAWGKADGGDFEEQHDLGVACHTCRC